MTDVVRIVFETHSLTVDNERGVATGWFGGALSAWQLRYVPPHRTLAASAPRRSGHGVRGPRGAPQPFAPSVEQMADFRRSQRNAWAGVEDIDRSDASMARIGVST